MKGHVRKRGEKWCFVLELPRDEVTGKRRQKWFSGYDTRKDAEKAMVEVINDINKGTYVEPTKVTVQSYLLDFLESKKTDVKPGTWKHYRWLTNHIISIIGHIQLMKLKPIHIEKLYKTALTEKGLSARTVRHMHVYLKEALEKAVDFEIIYKNSAKVVSTPKPKKPEIYIWDERQVKDFLLSVKEDRFFIAYVLALATGMRSGEILALKWRDIDFDNKILYVRRNLSKAATGYEVNEPKTESSKRKITLDDETILALKQHKAKQAEEKMKYRLTYVDNDFVIASKNGSFVLPRNLKRKWYKALELAKSKNIPPIRFHDLRHTHASHLLKQGVHIKAVSERLGHASIEITLNTYGHLLPGLQETAAHQFGESVMKGIIEKTAD